MTSRSVFIDLKARTGQYQRAMRKAENATTGVKKSLSGIFSGAAKAGVIGAAVGIAAIGAAAVKVGIEAAQAFAKFELTMSRIVGLVGISKEVVDGFSDSIRDISVATARGSQELAEALFFITSAGLEGQEALDALEASARAAAAGLGDTATIADVVTSAVNAYGPAMGGAAVATDVLVATVREGKAEASSLAGAMGRVIPIASQMGISFDQVGAAIAAMTRVGLDAAEASTALKGIMNSLLKPTTDASRALAEVGLSARGLREEIREKGLFAALQTITKAFEGQDEATVRVFGNVRALTGVLSLMGSNAGATEEIFNELATSTGSLDRAFAAAADTGAFAFEQARVRIENAILDVGEKILPMLADAIDDIAPLLPNLVEAFGDLAIIMTDLGVSVVPTLAAALEGLPQTILGVRSAFFDVKDGVSLASKVLAVATLNFGLLVGGLSDAEQKTKAFITTQIKVNNAIADGHTPLLIAVTAIQDMNAAGTVTGDNLATLQRQLGLTDEAWGEVAQNIINNADALDFTSIQLRKFVVVTEESRDAFQEQRQATLAANAAVADYRFTMEGAGSATTEASGAVSGMIMPLNLVSEALREAEGDSRSLADALLELVNPAFKAVKAVEARTKAEEKLEKVRKEAGKRITVEEAEAIARAELDFLEATLKAQGALSALAFDPASLEATIGLIELGLGKSRTEALLLLETLGILDGTQVTMLLELKTGLVGPLAGTTLGAGLFDLGAVGLREHGGPVTAGDPFFVGERGPELFIPERAGTVVSNSVLNQSMSRNVTVEINGAVFSSDVDVQAAVQAGLIAGGVTESVEWAGSTTIR